MRKSTHIFKCMSRERCRHIRVYIWMDVWRHFEKLQGPLLVVALRRATVFWGIYIVQMKLKREPTAYSM